MKPRQPAHKHGAKPGRMSSEDQEVQLPAVSLTCRACGTEHGLEAITACSRCFGPLDPVYDWDLLRATVTRERFAAGPPNIWRYADLLPVEPPEQHRLPAGLTPLVSADRLADELGLGELWLKLDTANPTHSFKDRVVAVAAAKAQEFGFSTLSCSSTGNLAGAVAARAAAEGLDAAVFCPADLEPEKLASAGAYGARIYAVNGHYDACSRLTVELSFELPWGFVNVNLRSYYAEGSKTIAYEIAEQLGWHAPDAIAIPIASGALYHKVGQGFSELQELGLLDGTTPRLYGGQAAGCQPVATAFAEGARVKPVRPDSIARSLAIGSPADGDFAVATAHETGGAIYSVPEDLIGDNMAYLAQTTGVFGETATGVTLGALRQAIEAGHLGRDSRVVLLVTGDGLKTPGPVSFTHNPIPIEADADAFVEDVLPV
jgi:threonine synthase